MKDWSQGTVVERHEWAPGLFTLTVNAETEAGVAGQFFNIGIPVGDDFVRRSYSAASAPGAPLEFFISRVEDGSLSPQLADLELGSPVWVEPRARGFFTLDYLPSARDLWLVATGTGLGPYISMLRSGEAFQRFERVVLVHGVRLGVHLAYAEELAQISASHDHRLVRVPVVSREAIAGTLHGRITTALVEGRLEAQADCAIDPATAHLMLCGNPAMIDEMMAALVARGLRRHRQRNPGHVTYEKYW